MNKTKYEGIAPSLASKGRLLKLTLSHFHRFTYPLLNFSCALLYKNKWKSSKTNREIVSLAREDGTKLRCIVVRPIGTIPNGPAVLWIHGGGYGFGIPEQDSNFIKMFALTGNSVVISPDYRTSAKKPYPAALEDCYLALSYLKEHIANYGARSIFVGGDSAGGGLTVATCLLARDKGEIHVSYMMPLYPMLDDRETPSNRDNRMPVWNTYSNYQGWKNYLREQYRTPDLSPYAAPARETNWKGMPETLTYIGTVDPFHDETLTMIQKLNEAGVTTHLLEVPGAYHNFENSVPKAPESQQAKKFLKEEFRKAVEKYR